MGKIFFLMKSLLTSVATDGLLWLGKRIRHRERKRVEKAAVSLFRVLSALLALVITGLIEIKSELF
jgi:hypothetical protein